MLSHSGTIKTSKENSSEELYELLGSERQEGYALVLSILIFKLRRVMSMPPLKEPAMRRIRKIILSDQIEALERQIAELQQKKTNVYGRSLDDAGKEEVTLEIAELRKRIASVKNELRKIS